MKPHSPYILYQIARFGALTIHELQIVCQGACSRSGLYRSLEGLLRSKLIRRIPIETARSPVYMATEAGIRATLGNGRDPARFAAHADHNHTLRVAKTLLALARHENVTGICSEFELSVEEIRDFSGTKIPDGLIQVTRGNLIYELAIEVEVTPKAYSRSQEFLEKYKNAFEKGVICSGVFVICDEENIYDRYRGQLEQMGQSVAERFLILQGPDLPTINPLLYGQPEKHVGFCCEKRRTSFQGGIRYFPMKFACGEFWRKPVTHTL
jgi:hypothetical protein